MVKLGLILAAAAFFICALLFTLIAQDEKTLLQQFRDQGKVALARSKLRDLKQAVAICVTFTLLCLIEVAIAIWG